MVLQSLTGLEITKIDITRSPVVGVTFVRFIQLFCVYCIAHVACFKHKLAALDRLPRITYTLYTNNNKYVCNPFE